MRAIEDYGYALRLGMVRAEIYASRGYALLKNGDYDSAIEDYSAVAGLDPNSATAYSWRGWAYERKGEIAKAIADYDLANQLAPEDPWVAQRLRDLGVAD